MFDSDDNADDLSFDGQPKPASPKTHSSSPSRPAPRTPFGANADQVESPSRPVRPGTAAPQPKQSSPFGQPAPSRPQPTQRNNSMPEQVSQSVNTESNEPPRSRPPFNKPEISRPQPAQQPTPVVPDLSSYLPPKTAPEPELEQAPEEDLYSMPERLSEDELYIRDIKEKAAQRAEEARKEEEQRTQNVKASNTVSPQAVAQALPVEPQPEETKEESKKKKGGFFSPPPKKAKQGKKSTTKTPTENKYDGERKKILYIRIVSGTVGAIIAVAGLQAIFVPDSGPSKEQVMSAAQESVNFTGFPTVSGEQFALDFTKAYLNFDSTNEKRASSLERFASPDLVKEIDIQTLSSQEYESIAKSGESYSDYKVTQSITYGPYVVATNNLTKEHALFTVKVGVQSGAVMYLDVPVKYNPSNYSLTLAGPPSFSKPIQNKGAAEKDEWTTTFENGADAEIADSLQQDLEAYLGAWAQSDSTIIDRYLLKSATDNAKKGLQKSVRFHSIVQFQVEPFSEDKPQTANARRVEINVMWEDSKTNIRYPQQYRMLIGLNEEGKWAIHDIENFVVLN